VIDLPRGRPGEVIVAINARAKRYFDAYRLDLETGELQLIEENPGDVDAWHVDSHGDIRACTAQVGTKTEIRASRARFPPQPRRARLRLGIVPHIGYLHG